jgi:hypothetical protein
MGEIKKLDSGDGKKKAQPKAGLGCPSLARFSGALARACDVFYRGHAQRLLSRGRGTGRATFAGIAVRGAAGGGRSRAWGAGDLDLVPDMLSQFRGVASELIGSSAVVGKSVVSTRTAQAALHAGVGAAAGWRCLAGRTLGGSGFARTARTLTGTSLARTGLSRTAGAGAILAGSSLCRNPRNAE